MTNSEAIRAVLATADVGITINDVTVFAFSAGNGRGFGGVEICRKDSEPVAIPARDLLAVISVLTAIAEG